ncbi:MAG: hypothetical protein DI594_17415 [Shewanella oneidensis]|nr:MAG: hypothetical protein DI594_17415 [Shewanella oneidensis]
MGLLFTGFSVVAVNQDVALVIPPTLLGGGV